MSKQIPCKALKAGTLSNPYRRVKPYVESEEILMVDEKTVQEASWLVPVEDYKKPEELPIVPNMDITNKPTGGDVHEVPPAPAGENYNQAVKEVQAAELVQDGKAANMGEAMEKVGEAEHAGANPTPDNVTEVKPGKFVGEAQPPQPVAEPVTETNQEGTGNQEVIA